MRDQLKAQQREIDRLKMKIATGGGAAAGGDLVEIGGVSVWTPRFEGLDRQAHSEVVKRWQNEHRDRPFVLVSSSVAEEGVHVISAVSDSLKDKVKAPEVMKRLGCAAAGGPTSRRAAGWPRARWTPCGAGQPRCPRDAGGRGCLSARGCAGVAAWCWRPCRTSARRSTRGASPTG
jgi:hypothetical protein